MEDLWQNLNRTKGINNHRSLKCEILDEHKTRLLLFTFRMSTYFLRLRSARSLEATTYSSPQFAHKNVSLSPPFHGELWIKEAGFGVYSRTCRRVAAPVSSPLFVRLFDLLNISREAKRNETYSWRTNLYVTLSMEYYAIKRILPWRTVFETGIHVFLVHNLLRTTIFDRMIFSIEECFKSLSARWHHADEIAKSLGDLCTQFRWKSIISKYLVSSLKLCLAFWLPAACHRSYSGHLKQNTQSKNDTLRPRRWRAVFNCTSGK